MSEADGCRLRARHPGCPSRRSDGDPLAQIDERIDRARVNVPAVLLDDVTQASHETLCGQAEFDECLIDGKLTERQPPHDVLQDRTVLGVQASTDKRRVHQGTAQSLFRTCRHRRFSPSPSPWPQRISLLFRMLPPQSGEWPTRRSKPMVIGSDRNLDRLARICVSMTRHAGHPQPRIGDVNERHG